MVFLLPKIFKLFGFSNILTLIVPDEGYSRNVSCALNLLSMFLLNLLNFFFFQDVSVSNWHLMVFSCDFNGTVVATYYPAVFGEKKPHRSKLVSIIENSCLGNHVFNRQFAHFRLLIPKIIQPYINTCNIIENCWVMSVLLSPSEMFSSLS